MKDSMGLEILRRLYDMEYAVDEYLDTVCESHFLESTHSLSDAKLDLLGWNLRDAVIE